MSCCCTFTERIKVSSYLSVCWCMHACKTHWLLLIGQSCRRPSHWVRAPPGTVSVSITAEDAAMRPPTPSTPACHCVWRTVSFNSFPQTHTQTIFFSMFSSLSIPFTHTKIHTRGCTRMYTHIHILGLIHYELNVCFVKDTEQVLSHLEWGTLCSDYIVWGKKISCWFIPKPISLQWKP